MKRTVIAVTLIIASVTVAISADTLVLTNGRRIQGELLGVFGREIEFEERNGGNRRIVRVARNEIARIEFVEDQGNGGNDVPTIPRGMRERRVTVGAREAWTDTGIDVRSGQQVYFQPSGETRWGPGRRDGAAGERNSPYNANRPLPDRPAASLIARVGERNEVFFIGDDPGPYRMRGNGRLFLGINDDVLTDNSGTLRVMVSY
jgi:hypothetical protein